jgi:hypothetical protein
MNTLAPRSSAKRKAASWLPARSVVTCSERCPPSVAYRCGSLGFRRRVSEGNSPKPSFPSGIDNKPRLRFRRRDDQQAGPGRQPVYRPCRGRAERDVGEQTLAGARAGPHAKVRRMEHDCGGFETDDHSSCPKWPRLKLYHILIDQLDARAGGRGIADLDHPDCGRDNGAFHDFYVLRNSDRRSGRPAGSSTWGEAIAKSYTHCVCRVKPKQVSESCLAVP